MKLLTAPLRWIWLLLVVAASASAEDDRPMRWVKDNGHEDGAYATAFATLILGTEEGRLSIANRTRPKLPAAAAK